MEIFELRESIDSLRSSGDMSEAKKMLLELKDVANGLCDTIEVSPSCNAPLLSSHLSPGDLPVQ
jgi:hypothetical protein